jgi:hypothetical protein
MVADLIDYNKPPPHRLPSARKAAYDPDGSSIYIVEHSKFEKFKPGKIQEIFRHRHILVRNTPGRGLEFDSEGLSTIGSMKKEVCFQGEPCENFLKRFQLTKLISGGEKGRQRSIPFARQSNAGGPARGRHQPDKDAYP